jgi:hypothetical protein
MQGNPGWFTSLDLFPSYNQIGLTEDVKQKCAFSSIQKDTQDVRDSNTAVAEWLESVIKPFTPKVERTQSTHNKQACQRYPTTIEDINLNLPEFGVKYYPRTQRAPNHGIKRAINLVQVMQGQTSRKRKSRISFTRISQDPKIIIPKKKHQYDAGYDLQSTETAKIPPGGMMLMKTGIKCSIPRG